MADAMETYAMDALDMAEKEEEYFPILLAAPAVHWERVNGIWRKIPLVPEQLSADTTALPDNNLQTTMAHSNARAVEAVAHTELCNARRNTCFDRIMAYFDSTPACSS